MSLSVKRSDFFDVLGFVFEAEIHVGLNSEVLIGYHKELDDRVLVKIWKFKGGAVDLIGDVDPQKFLGQQTFPEEGVPLIYDCGRFDDLFYQIFQYVEGESLHQLLFRGISLSDLCDVLCQVASILDNLHKENIYHLDLKPENILVAGENKAFLIDFPPDFTVFGEEEGMLRKEVELSTPEYMSPEYTRFGDPSAGADFFSLGVVLHQSLTGYLPALPETDTGMAPTSQKMSLSRLPNQFSDYQGLMEKALDSSPDKRFKSGAEFVAGLKNLKDEMSSLDLSIRNEPISSEEIFRVGSYEFDRINENARNLDSTNSHSNKIFRRVAVTFVGVLMLAGTSFFVAKTGFIPEFISNFIPLNIDSDIESARLQAQSLGEDPNQGLSTIMAAYNRLLTLAPADESVVSDMADLKAGWINSIRDALDEGRYKTAESRMEEAEASFVQDASLNELSIRLQNWQRAELLFETSLSLRLGFSEKEAPVLNSAMIVYQNVLRLAPGHEGALEELKDISGRFAEMAAGAFAVKDLTGAINYLERANTADSTIGALEEVRDLLSQANELKVTIDMTLDKASVYRSINQLVSPAGENAAELYNRVLVAEPKNILANQALGEVTSRIQMMANRLLQQGDLSEAERLLNQSVNAGLEEGFLADIRKQIGSERGRVEQVSRSLKTARELMSKGYLTLPLGNNAVDELRVVQGLDPENLEALEMLYDCANILVNVAKDANEFGFFSDALDYLDLAIAIDPGKKAWIELREAWQTKFDFP